jgi:hypothetical protein
LEERKALAMEVHLTPEQEAQLAQIARATGKPTPASW